MKQNIIEYPEMLAKVILKNPINESELIKYQSQLTMLSRDVTLSDRELNFPSLFNNRGISGGKCRLVDLLKTLGAGIDNPSLTTDAERDAMDLYISSLTKNPINKVLPVLSELLEIEGIKTASITIEANKNTPLISGFYLLYPLLEMIHTVIITQCMSTQGNSYIASNKDSSVHMMALLQILKV